MAEAKTSTSSTNAPIDASEKSDVSTKITQIEYKPIPKHDYQSVDSVVISKGGIAYIAMDDHLISVNLNDSQEGKVTIVEETSFFLDAQLAITCDDKYLIRLNEVGLTIYDISSGKVYKKLERVTCGSDVHPLTEDDYIFTDREESDFFYILGSSDSGSIYRCCISTSETTLFSSIFNDDCDENVFATHCCSDGVSSVSYVLNFDPKNQLFSSEAGSKKSKKVKDSCTSSSDITAICRYRPKESKGEETSILVWDNDQHKLLKIGTVSGATTSCGVGGDERTWNITALGMWKGDVYGFVMKKDGLVVLKMQDL